MSVAALAILLLLRPSRSATPFGFIAAFFAYFTLGPAVAYGLGLEIYPGIQTEWIVSAAWLYAAVLLLWAALDLAFSTARPGPPASPAYGLKRTILVDLVFVFLGVYGAALGAIVFMRGGGNNKLVAIELAGPLHYQFMLTGVGVILYCGATGTRSLRSWPVVIGLIGFLAYCISTGERDFLFVIFTLLLVWLAVGLTVNRGAVWLWAIGGVVLGSALFVWRGGASNGLTTALSQGSNMYIDTVLLQARAMFVTLPEDTYLSTFLRSDYAGYDSLASWFSDFVGAGLTGGYGFSTVGEALLNGGLLGVLGYHAIVFVGYEFLYRKARRSPYAVIALASLTYQLLYGVRTESQSVLTGFITVCVIGWILVALSRVSLESAGSKVPDPAA